MLAVVPVGERIIAKKSVFQCVKMEDGKLETDFSSTDEDQLKIDEDVKVGLEKKEEGESSDSDPTYEPPAKVGRHVPSRASKLKAMGHMKISPRRAVSFKETDEGGKAKMQKTAGSKTSSMPQGIVKAERGLQPEIPMQSIDTAALAKTTVYPEIDEGPRFIPGMRPVFVTSQGSRQSVGMKAQLSVIEKSVARMMQERHQIDRVTKVCHKAIATLGEEERVLRDLSSLMASMGPPGDQFSPGEFKEFFLKRFLGGDVAPEPEKPTEAAETEGSSDGKDKTMTLD